MELKDLQEIAKKKGIGKITPLEYGGKTLYIKQLTTREVLKINSVTATDGEKQSLIMFNALVTEDGELMFNPEQRDDVMDCFDMETTNKIAELAMGGNFTDPVANETD